MAEPVFQMNEPTAETKTEIFLFLFKQMVDDATNRLQESCPDLAAMVKEAECGR